MTAVARLDHVDLSYGTTPVLKSVDLEICRGEILALVGPSGAGKSTLLKLLSGEIPPDSGTITRPEDTGEATRIVFQQPHLQPWRTVARNIRLGLEFSANKTSRADADSQVGQLLIDLGIADLAHRYPRELSGGQAGRAAIARAVAANPSLLLLDEPFGALDPASRADLQDWLREIHGQLGLATIVVTHDLEEALLLGDRIGLLHAKPGPIEYVTSAVKTREDLADGRARAALLAKFDGLTEQRELLKGVDDTAAAKDTENPASLVATPEKERQATRRQVLTLAGTSALLAAPVLAYATTRPEQRTPGPIATGQPGGPTVDATLRIGYLPITDASPLLLAHDYGEFAARGITTPAPTLYRGWAPIVEGLQGGSVDIVHLLMPLAVQLRYDAQVPVKVLAWNHTNGSALVASKSITEVSQFAGTTVAIPAWFSIHNIVLQKLFREAGLTAVINEAPSTAAGTVQLVVVPPADMPAALEAGSISGYIVAEPFCAVAEVLDIGHVLRFSGDVWKDHACCVTVVREELVADNPDVAQAAAEAIIAAQLRIRADRDDAALRLSDGGYLPQPLPAIQKTLLDHIEPQYLDSGAVIHPEWDQKRIDFQPFPFPTYTKGLVEAMKETAVDAGTGWLIDLDPNAVHNDLVATDISANAINANGGLTAFNTNGYRTEVIAP